MTSAAVKDVIVVRLAVHHHFVLELQITVVKDLGEIPLEFDLLNFETSRVAVLAMTRTLRAFDGDFSDDFDDEELPE